jgi:Zn-dependent protease
LTSPLELLRVDPLAFFLLATAIIFALALHEYAHALAADLQGDRMPRAMGRLSLNPAKHLDPLGTILIFLVGFGWAKPVQFRPSALSSKRFGAAVVAFAGPLMNLLLALVAAFVMTGLLKADIVNVSMLEFLLLFISINVFLAVFNLIPIPPLDGSRLLTIFLPPQKQNIIYFLDQYGMLILLAILLFGGSRVLAPIANAVEDFICTIAGGDSCIEVVRANIFD